MKYFEPPTRIKSVEELRRENAELDLELFGETGAFEVLELTKKNIDVGFIPADPIKNVERSSA